MNKRGQGIGAVIFISLLLFMLLIGGLFLAFGAVTMNWVADEVVPQFTGLGMVGNTNASQVSQMTIVPVNNVIQSFTWLTGVIYVMGLFGCLILAFSFRFTGNKWLMALFFGLMLLLIITSIFVSNIYQDFYMGSDDVGTRLHEFTLLSFMILQSPLIMCIIGFVCGIVMFSGENEGVGI